MSTHLAILRAAESMLLFERDGMIAYGVWRRWRQASQQEADDILRAFQKGGRPAAEELLKQGR